MMRRMPALTAEMIAMTMVATTRHRFPEQAPPMARLPEMKKKTDVQMPVATGMWPLKILVMSAERVITPQRR